MLQFLYIEAYVRLDDVPDMISFRHTTVAAWNETQAYDLGQRKKLGRSHEVLRNNYVIRVDHPDVRQHERTA